MTPESKYKIGEIVNTPMGAGRILGINCCHYRIAFGHGGFGGDFDNFHESEIEKMSTDNTESSSTQENQDAVVLS